MLCRRFVEPLRSPKDPVTALTELHATAAMDLGGILYLPSNTCLFAVEARAGYQQFLTIRKDAGPDIPSLIAAKA